MSDFKVVADKHNLSLYRYIPAHEKPNGDMTDPRWEVLGHYTSLATLVNAYIEHCIKAAIPDGGMEEALSALRDEVARLKEEAVDELVAALMFEEEEA